VYTFRIALKLKVTVEIIESKSIYWESVTSYFNLFLPACFENQFSNTSMVGPELTFLPEAHGLFSSSIGLYEMPHFVPAFRLIFYTWPIHQEPLSQPPEMLVGLLFRTLPPQFLFLATLTAEEVPTSPLVTKNIPQSLPSPIRQEFWELVAPR
jgi:hypothetical protein